MEKFLMGIDIGTDSVGIACTDERYNLLRAKRKDLWAVRLFDEAQPAKKRREKRASRRRLMRRRQRIEFLQGVFAPFMTDANFFIRLNNSGFYFEDKDDRLQSKFSLLNDLDYNDAHFYKEYPTIFHLRRDLINGKVVDLRLYYLALHHIIKYRGHFLFEGEDTSEFCDVQNLLKNYNEASYLCDLEDDVDLSLDKSEQFKDLALERKGLNDKKKQAFILFDAETQAKREWIALMLGATAAFKKLFGEKFKEQYQDKKISFKDVSDEDFDALSEILEEEHFDLLTAAKAVYKAIALERVLKGNSCISEAMIKLYEKHANDLQTLKKFMRENYGKAEYLKVFYSPNETANYVNYVGYTRAKGKKVNVKKCKNIKDFYKFIEGFLTDDVQDIQTRDYIKEEIANETFMPKIINADNGLFPHQINGMELDAILKNLESNYPAFVKRDESGYSAVEKIKKIFLFKIPYYIGPLNVAHEKDGKGNAWMVRNEGKTEKITPWNFDDVVNKTASNEKFIRRMTNKCSYLHNQDVLPKGSMYYQAFNVLNHINKLTIDGKPVSVELKQLFFNELFLKNKKVGLKQIKDFLVIKGFYSQSQIRDVIIGGFDTVVDMKANMLSYVTFKEKLGKIVDERPEIFENIILWHTLNTDKLLVEKTILNAYGDIPSIKDNIKWLKGLTSFKEFGSLSKKLLCELVGGIDVVTGEVFTILNRLYHTNLNFNQLLFDESYSFGQAIQDENSGKSSQITYEDVEDLYVSPMVRRGVWQALQMADEYVKAIGKAPDRIFVEVTRKKEKNERKDSRKNKILKLYSGLGADCDNIDNLLEMLNRKDMTDAKLRQEKLYLYFLQLGRCAYTGEPIDLADLQNDSLYDVDHIIPRSFIKDDSIENKVLVKRSKNREKTDVYPLPLGFSDQKGFWKMLKSKGLMGERKYANLTRTEPLSEDDYREFLNRQLVVTNQTAKAVAELLKCKYEDFGTKIIYSKASNVDDFKQQMDIVKCRETNDLHHARDAYLNIVVGNVYYVRFSSVYDRFYHKADGSLRQYNLKNLFKKQIDGAWDGEGDVARVKKIVGKTSAIVTRYSYTNQGEFYNETVYGKQDGGIVAPRKNCFPYNQTDKYGGFKSLTTAYFAIVQSVDKKGEIIKTIEAIPVLIDYRAKHDKNAIMHYLLDSGLKEPKIIIPKIKTKALISINGFKAWIAGVTGKQILIHNAQQWYTDSPTDLYVKNIAKLIKKDVVGKLSDEEKSKEEIPLISSSKGTTLLATKTENLQVYDAVIATLRKKAYQGVSAVKSFEDKLQEKRETFASLSTFNQAKVLCQIAKFMKCNAESADLKLLNEGAACGKLLINKNITKTNFAIIHQSPCGLVERVQKV